MRVQTSVLVGAACLSGGIDVSVGGGAAAFLPWDATAAAATTTFNTLLGVSASEDGVHVERRGDGQSSAVFVVRHLRGGARPALLAVDGAPLHRRSYAVDWATHTDNADSAAASLEHTAPGGIELLPLPGRYLSAPTNESTVRLSSTSVQLYCTYPGTRLQPHVPRCASASATRRPRAAPRRIGQPFTLAAMPPARSPTHTLAKRVPRAASTPGFRLSDARSTARPAPRSPLPSPPLGTYASASRRREHRHSSPPSPTQRAIPLALLTTASSAAALQCTLPTSRLTQTHPTWRDNLLRVASW